MKREKYLSQFHKRMKAVIRMRHRKVPATFDEIGERFGISRQRASKLYKRGLEVFGDDR